MSDEHKKIIEINGVKLEVDLRMAKVIDSYRIGESVKVLEKYYSGYTVSYGAIIGFTDFQKQPTIELLVVNNSGEVRFLAYNASTQDAEIAPLNKQEIRFDYENISQALDRKVIEAETALQNAREKKRAFIDSFGTIFSEEGEKK